MLIESLQKNLLTKRLAYGILYTVDEGHARGCARLHLRPMKGVCLPCLSPSIRLSPLSLLPLWNAFTVRPSCVPTASLRPLGSSLLRWKRLLPRHAVSCVTARTSLHLAVGRGECGKTATTAAISAPVRMPSPRGCPRSAAATPAAGRCPIIRNGNIPDVIFLLTWFDVNHILQSLNLTFFPLFAII